MFNRFFFYSLVNFYFRQNQEIMAHANTFLV